MSTRPVWSVATHSGEHHSETSSNYLCANDFDQATALLGHRPHQRQTAAATQLDERRELTEWISEPAPDPSLVQR
jgi:hypothetical protein